jgi:heterodisulfide reductase subunit A-like polyferredoxin
MMQQRALVTRPIHLTGMLGPRDGKTMASNEVLIIGGGIAGMQAALDLAEMGIRVHLVEKNPSIGGKMARLDKTFPTNDCTI